MRHMNRSSMNKFFGGVERETTTLAESNRRQSSSGAKFETFDNFLEDVSLLFLFEKVFGWHFSSKWHLLSLPKTGRPLSDSRKCWLIFHSFSSCFSQGNPSKVPTIWQHPNLNLNNMPTGQYTYTHAQAHTYIGLAPQSVSSSQYWLRSAAATHSPPSQWRLLRITFILLQDRTFEFSIVVDYERRWWRQQQSHRMR